MKSYRLFSLIVAAAAFCATACINAAAPVVAVMNAAAQSIKKFVLAGVDLLGAAGKTAAVSIVPFVQAKAFVLRLIKRDRPEVSSNWRMCPST